MICSIARSKTITAFAASSCVAKEILAICDGRSGELPSITSGMDGVYGVDGVDDVGGADGVDGVGGVGGVGLEGVKPPDGVEVI